MRNPNSGTALTGVGFTDRLPDGLVLARPLGLTGTCGGGTITATAGGRNIRLTGATLPAGRSCTFAVKVTGTTGGMKVNTTAAVISVESGPGPRASSRIRVGDGPPALPVTGSPGSTYVTTAIVMIGLGVLFLMIGRRERR